MARTIAQIKKQQTDLFISHPAIIRMYDLVSGLTFEDQFSVVSLESILFYIVASAIWTLDNLFDLLRKEINAIIDLLKPHTTRWYANKAKLFQYGFNLLSDSDRYDNTGKTDEQIKASRIVAYSAVTDLGKEGLIVKVAKDQGDDLAPLSDAELLAFREYMSRIKDAGVFIETISKVADEFRLHLKVHFNPLDLNAEGQRLDGQSLTPVTDAIHNYLKNLPFNGVMVLASLTDVLQQVEGVVIPTIINAEYRYGDLDWSVIDILYQPFSGYLRLIDVEIEYIAQSEIL